MSWFKKKNRVDLKTAPAFWQRYLESVTPLAKETPLHEIPFVVFDTETTGLDPNADKILAIGAVKLKNREIEVGDTLELFLKQDYRPTAPPVEIHGILPVDREGSVNEEEAIRRFLAFAGNSILAGHHVGFDIAMVNSAVKRLIRGDQLRNASVDTMHLARRLLRPAFDPRGGNFSLDYLCRYFKVPMNDRHTAAGDAFITALLLMKLLNRLEGRGVRTYGALQRRFF